jgi:hypothetical protein
LKTFDQQDECIANILTQKNASCNFYSTHSRDEKEDTAHGIVLVEDIRHQSKEFYDENPHTK